MCGISGIILREGERALEADLKIMADAMMRRGPDAEGFFTSENVGLAHRRLKIIDLSDTANQPLFNEDGKVSVVYNGEIYNFRELKAELEALGHRFKTKSDTEVIVHAYEQWGLESFRRYNGMFAFGLWDGRGRHPVVYLVNDRFGIKPLFYGVQEKRLAFASELKPLMTVPWLTREIDPQVVFQFLKFSHVPTPLSIYKSIRKLEPGSWLRIELGDIQKGIYWNSVKEMNTGPEASKMSEIDALDELQKTLRNSVDRQLVSDVPLGCFLSGGIDSSLLVMACTELFGSRAGAKKMKTFSIGYKEARYDESQFARELAGYYGTDHHELIVGPDDFFDIIPDVALHFDMPFADPTLLPSLLLSKFARNTVTVALSGDGGDELFFGYSQQRALLYLHSLRHVPGPIRKGVFSGLEEVASSVALGPLRRLGQRAKKLLEILQFENESELFQYFIGTIGPMRVDRIAALLKFKVDPHQALIEPLLNEMIDRPIEEVVTQVFLRTFLVDTVLTKTDRAGMAFGLEARVPFLDDEMVKFSTTVPFHLKNRMTGSKYLLRKLMERNLSEKGLPTSLSKRPKQGFSIPMAEWLRGNLKYLMDEYLSEARLKREGIFSSQAVRQLVREHLSNQANHSHLLWSLLSFQLWKERYP